MKSARKELFVVLGDAQLVDGKKRFVPTSKKYLDHGISKLPLGKTIELKFSVTQPTRSSSQLAYHWVLMGLLSEHTGFTKEELHDAVVRLKFGTKKVYLGKGRIIEVRKSVSDNAKMPLQQMSDLIEYDIELCKEMEIVIPTPEELGYMVDANGKIIK